jgi:hypothetical protein
VPGLVPGIHVLLNYSKKDVDGRDKPDKPGHDEDIRDAGYYPRPTNGILLAMTVMNSTLASSGRLAM